MIGLNAFREILRDRRFENLLLIMETPDYFGRNRLAPSALEGLTEKTSLGAMIAEIEIGRHEGEKSFLSEIAKLTDAEWQEEEASQRRWKKYKKMKTSCERRIHKIAAKTPSLFSKMRKWRRMVGSYAVKISWLKRQRTSMLARA